MNIFNALINRLSSFIWWLTGCLVLGVALLAAWEVVMRYFFKSPHNWVDDLVVAVVTACAFLTIANVLKDNRHITVDVLYLKLSERWKRIANFVTYLVALVTFAVITVFAWKWMGIVKATGAASQSSMPIPQWIFSAVLIAGILLSVLFSFWKLIRLLREGQVN